MPTQIEAATTTAITDVLSDGIERTAGEIRDATGETLVVVVPALNWLRDQGRVTRRVTGDRWPLVHWRAAA